ncbi:unnamed protein product [Ilex paraguariensis]|uniref:AT-hook motif nuclear-localized protein n=1 Tax=Ilex paraguariensis TaxID=185542 RepID=A0ABC8UU54_9AQUA
MDGTPPYYLNRGVSGSGSASGPSGSVPASGSGTQTGLPAPPGFKTSSNPNISFQSNVGSTYQVENPSPSFPHGIAMGVAPSGVSPGDTGKKKRGRPRKYGPDSANMSLLLSPMSSTPSPGSLTPRRGRGRPPGSGRKQQLASLGLRWHWSQTYLVVGDWYHTRMCIPRRMDRDGPNEIRAVLRYSACQDLTCLLKMVAPATGLVGRFEILCLSGSYLLAENGGPRNRTGGLSISICSPDGHIIGGAIGGKLVAASPAQVVVCSFVYGGSKTKNKTEAGPNGDNSTAQSGENSSAPNAAPGHNLSPNSATNDWPPKSRLDLTNPHAEIDLTRG